MATRNKDSPPGVAVDSCVLLNLPNEIWSYILDHVPQTDRICHRLVSKAWRDSLDEFSTYKVGPFQDNMSPTKQRRLLDLRIRSCEFTYLRNPFEPMFRYPLLMKDIVFGSHVTTSNIRQILSVCLNVESLTFYTIILPSNRSTTEILEEDAKRISLCLKQLKSLEIIVNSIASRITNSTICPLIASFIGNDSIVFSSISKLSITCSFLHSEWNQFFRFLQIHKDTIKCLSVIFQCAKPIEKQDLQSKLAVQLSDSIVEQLMKLRLKKFVILRNNDGVSCQCGMKDVLLEILQAQNSLEYLEVNCLNKLSFIENVLGKNSDSLRSVQFLNVKIGTQVETLRGSMFGNCHFLQHINLSFKESATVILSVSSDCITTFEYRFELIELKDFPKSLKTLHIDGCAVRSTELLEMSQNSPNLKELQLKNFSTAHDARCDGFDAFLNICANVPHLSTLRVDKDFGKSTTVIPRELNKKWETIVSTATDMGILDITANKSDNCPIGVPNDGVYEFSFSDPNARTLFVNTALFARQSQQ